MTDTTQRTDTGGDHGLVEWTSRNRTRRGEPYEDVFTVRGGRIQAVREYMDPASATHMLFDGERAAV